MRRTYSASSCSIITPLGERGPQGQGLLHGLRSIPRGFDRKRNTAPPRDHTAASSTVCMEGEKPRIPPVLYKALETENLELHNDLQIGKPYPNELLPLVEHARTFMDIPVPDSGIERAHTRDFFDEGIAGDGKCHTSCYAVG